MYDSVSGTSSATGERLLADVWPTTYVRGIYTKILPREQHRNGGSLIVFSGGGGVAGRNPLWCGSYEEPEISLTSRRPLEVAMYHDVTRRKGAARLRETPLYL